MLRVPSRSRAAAFTLVELLVVIGIVAVLLGLALPAIQRVRVMADKVKDMNNLNQIGKAFFMYAQDHKGKWPVSTHTASVQEAWIYQLGKYMGDIDDVRISPMDPRAAERRAAKSTSYTLNEYTSVKGPFQCLSDRECTNRSGTIVVFTGSDKRGLTSGYDHTHSRQWFALPVGVWNRVTGNYGIQPDRFGGSLSSDGYSGSAHYLYADGHVNEIESRQIRQWCEQGFDFAKPAQ